MLKRLTAILLLCALVLALATACGGKSSIITTEQAQKIALEAAGVSDEDAAQVHVHVGSYEDTPCFDVFVTVGSVTYEYMIDAKTGEVLYSGESDGGHSH